MRGRLSSEFVSSDRNKIPSRMVALVQVELGLLALLSLTLARVGVGEALTSPATSACNRIFYCREVDDQIIPL